MKETYFCVALLVSSIILDGTISRGHYGHTNLGYIVEEYSQEQVSMANIVESVRHVVKIHSETNFHRYCTLVSSPPGDKLLEIVNMLHLAQNSLVIVNTWSNSKEIMNTVLNRRNCSRYENIIVLTTMSDVEKVIAKVNVSCAGGRIKFLVAVYDIMENDHAAKESARIVVDFAWKHVWGYAIVLVPVLDGRILVLKSARHKPKIRCEPEAPGIISYWENETMTVGDSGSSFDVRLHNNECVARVAAANCGFLVRIVNVSGHETAAGIEGQMLKAIAKNLNYTMELISVVPPRIGQFAIPDNQVIFTNGSRAREKMESGEADIGSCSLWISYREDMKYTYSYSANHVVLMIPIPKYIPFDSIINAFDEPVWICILVGFLVGRILIRINGRSVSSLTILALFLGGPADSNPHGFIENWQITFWVIYGYLISQSYIAALTSVLNNPYLRRIQTIEELAESGDLRVVGFPLQSEYFKIDAKYKRIVDTFVKIEEVRYIHMLKDPAETLPDADSSAILIDLLAVNTFPWVSRYYQLKERISSLPFGMGVMSRRRISLDELNRVIMSLVEGGLIDKWAVDDGLGEKNPLISSDIRMRSPVLSLEELAGIFLILVIGLSLSTLVFASELYKKNRSENK